MGRGSTGPSEDRVYAHPEDRLVLGLRLRRDPDAPERHAFVEPAQRMKLERYEGLLAATLPQWSQVWP
jgi:hypothetical protein